MSSNPNIPLEFFENHLDKVNWSSLSCNSNIPLWFFEKHLDKIFWKEICANKFKKDKYVLKKCLDSLQLYSFDKQWKLT